MDRFRKFLRKPTRQKLASVTSRVRNAFKKKQIIALPCGLRWIAHQSYLDDSLLAESFETSEIRFVKRYLRPGMTMLDIGAHHGLYSLFAAQRVGKKGRVVAFEPSSHERKILNSHIRINKCWNIRIEPFAVGSRAEVATFFQVEDSNNCCSSLRPPATSSATRPVRVTVIPLDDYTKNHRIGAVDFIKIDTEGAELEVLKGATRTLTVRPRPVLLIEVAEIRTAPWGYPASMILEYVRTLNYTWHAIDPDGGLSAIPANPDINDANLVAVPLERVAEVTEALQSNGKRYAHAVHNG